MAADDTFQGAASAFTLMHAYRNRVAQDFGMDKALDMDSEVCSGLGAIRAGEIREEAGGEVFDLPDAREALARSILKDFGIGARMGKEGPDEVILEVGRCPVYEAARALGMDNQTVEAMCRATAMSYMNAMAKELNPDLGYELRRFRSSAEDCCEEAVVRH